MECVNETVTKMKRGIRQQEVGGKHQLPSPLCFHFFIRLSLSLSLSLSFAPSISLHFSHDRNAGLCGSAASACVCVSECVCVCVWDGNQYANALCWLLGERLPFCSSSAQMWSEQDSCSMAESGTFSPVTRTHTHTHTRLSFTQHTGLIYCWRLTDFPPPQLQKNVIPFFIFASSDLPSSPGSHQRFEALQPHLDIWCSIISFTVLMSVPWHRRVHSSVHQTPPYDAGTYQMGGVGGGVGWMDPAVVQFCSRVM